MSIGVADNLKCNLKEFNELFIYAEMRLYKDKKNGKNQVCACN
jgi:PleD family two-component response regulator